MDKIYKLLRNNRQTGPFSLEELVQLDLKPFDLIWADGKTAGWMYPSEIDVLKPYLREEKNEAVKAAEPVTPAANETSAPVQETATSPVATKAVTIPSSAKHIFISLPAGTTRPQATPVQNSPTPDAGVSPAGEEEETPEQKLERKAVELRQRVQAAAEAKKAEAEEPSLDTKYARSLEDIKEEYAHWMQEQRGKGRKKGISIQAIKAQGFKAQVSKAQVMRVALVLVIAGAGYGVFQWLSAPGAPETALSASQPVVTTPVSHAISKVDEEPAQTVINTDYSERNAELLTDLEKANRQIEEDLKGMRTEKGAAASAPKTAPAEEADLPYTYDEYEEAPAYERPSPSSPAVRTASVRTEKKAVPLGQQIDVKAKYLWTRRNKGLSGLELDLRNNSAQVLKTVAIDIFYYKDDHLLEKKTVYFTNVLPGESGKLTAPGNRRASSATYQLGLISSEGGLYVAKGS